MWAGAEGGMVVFLTRFFFGYLLCRRMNSADRNDLVPAQEKLEWVTPKISLMDAGDTDGSGKPPISKELLFLSGPKGPS